MKHDLIFNLLHRQWLLIVKYRSLLLFLFIAILVPLAIFGHLADEVLEGGIFGFDQPLLLLAYSWSNPWLDQVMIVISRLGYEWGVVPIDIGLFIFLVLKRQRTESLFFGLSVAGAGLLNRVTKVWFARERPDLWVTLVTESNYSFPSGHAMGATALCVALIVMLWPTKWRAATIFLGLFFVASVGFSRIYLGVHYPSDIVAGIAASFAWVMGLSQIFYQGWHKNSLPISSPFKA